MDWTGVMPAITTPFTPGMEVDHAAMAQHASWLLDHGCAAIVALGSLGEGATLSFDEKRAVLGTLVASCAGRAPVVAAIAALSTAEAVRVAHAAEQAGAAGLMILPPYAYAGDWPEMRAHVGKVLGATTLPAMLYNNPVAYRTDFLPEQIAELAGNYANLAAVKESSADVRRCAAVRALLGHRLALCMGVDDLVVEGIAAGAVGWVAGLVNAFPGESVALFDLARAGRTHEAWDLYRWFLPLLRLDTVPKFIQHIKYVQAAMGAGHARVRLPRLELAGAELASTEAVLREALRTRPVLGSGASALNRASSEERC